MVPRLLVGMIIDAQNGGVKHLISVKRAICPLGLAGKLRRYGDTIASPVALGPYKIVNGAFV